jgi:hypothetical protein
MPLAKSIKSAVGSVEDDQSSDRRAPIWARKNHTHSFKAFQSPPLHCLGLLMACAHVKTIHQELMYLLCAAGGARMFDGPAATKSMWVHTINSGISGASFL